MTRLELAIVRESSNKPKEWLDRSPDGDAEFGELIQGGTELESDRLAVRVNLEVNEAGPYAIGKLARPVAAGIVEVWCDGGIVNANGKVAELDSGGRSGH